MPLLWSGKESTEAEKHEGLESLRQRVAEANPAVAEQLARGGERLDEPCLLRWLRAENYNAEKAAKRLIAHAAWRCSFVPDGAIPRSKRPNNSLLIRVPEQESVQHELDTGKVAIQGCDKQGRGFIFLIGAKHIRSKRDLEETKRFICFSLDIASAICDPAGSGQLISVFDLRGFGVKNVDFSALLAVFDLLQSHYPERLGQLYFFEAPYAFQALWKAVSPFVDPNTRQKVKFISDKTAFKVLSEIFNPEVLPKQLGGKADLIPPDEALLRFKPGRFAEPRQSS